MSMPCSLSFSLYLVSSSFSLFLSPREGSKNTITCVKALAKARYESSDAQNTSAIRVVGRYRIQARNIVDEGKERGYKSVERDGAGDRIKWMCVFAKPPLCRGMVSVCARKRGGHANARCVCLAAANARHHPPRVFIPYETARRLLVSRS